MGFIDDLKQLTELRDSGSLSQEEFEAEKARLIKEREHGFDQVSSSAQPTKRSDSPPKPLVRGEVLTQAKSAAAEQDNDGSYRDSGHDDEMAQIVSERVRERNLFLLVFVLLAALTLFFNVSAAGSLPGIQFSDEVIRFFQLITFSFKPIMGYRAYRLATVCDLTMPSRVAYTFCAVMPCLYLIPLIGLPLAAARAPAIGEFDPDRWK